jgi:hypothetical protein
MHAETLKVDHLLRVRAMMSMASSVVDRWMKYRLEDLQTEHGLYLSACLPWPLGELPQLSLVANSRCYPIPLLHLKSSE